MGPYPSATALTNAAAILYESITGAVVPPEVIAGTAHELERVGSKRPSSTNTSKIDDQASNKRRAIADDHLVEIDVPGYGTCFYYSVVLAYLLPKLEDIAQFSEAYRRLFGPADEAAVKILNKHLRKYDGSPAFINHSALIENLVEKNFRRVIAEHMLEHKDECLADALAMPGVLYPKYVVDIKSLEDYIRAQQQPLSWADNPEIKAVQQLLQVRLHIQRSENGKYVAHLPLDDNDYPVIELVYKGCNHYVYLLKFRYVPVKSTTINPDESDAIDLGLPLTEADSATIKFRDEVIAQLYDKDLTAKITCLENLRKFFKENSDKLSYFFTKKFYTAICWALAKSPDEEVLKHLLAILGALVKNPKGMYRFNTAKLCLALGKLLCTDTTITNAQGNLRILILEFLQSNPMQLEMFYINQVHDILIWGLNHSNEGIQVLAFNCLKNLFNYLHNQILLATPAINAGLKKVAVVSADKAASAKPIDAKKNVIEIRDMFSIANSTEYFVTPLARRLLANAFDSYADEDIKGKLFSIIMSILLEYPGTAEDFGIDVIRNVVLIALKLDEKDQMDALKIISSLNDNEAYIKALSSLPIRNAISNISTEDDALLLEIASVILLLPSAPPESALLFKDSPSASDAGAGHAVGC